MEKRTLYKVFGIRLDILVNGKVRVDSLDPWDSSAISLGRHQLCNTAPGFCGIRKTGVNVSLGAGLLTGTLGEYRGREDRRKICFIDHIFHLWLDQWICVKNFVMGVGGPVETQTILLIFPKAEHLHFSFLSFYSYWERRLSSLCSHGEYSKCILLFGCLVLVGFLILNIQEGK